jgi:hypothetical protein
MNRIATLLLLCATGVAAALPPAPAAAQEPTLRQAGLPSAVEARLETLLRAPATTRMAGPVRIDAGRTIQGDLVVTGGALHLAGVVTGELLVVGGDLELAPGARVGGDVWVVGGEARGYEVATLGGGLTMYGEGFRPDWRSEVFRDQRVRRRPTRRADPDALGRARLSLRVADSYNRVEGLPLAFGPVIETAGPNPLRLEALAIWRTTSGASLETDEMGYRVRLEQLLAGRTLGVGASLHSLIDPIEDAGIRNVEASLATLLFHADQRDHFERRGWGAHLRWEPRDLPVRGLVQFRAEEHETVPVNDPWTLFRGGAGWRLQPLVAHGDVRTLGVSGEFDTRDHERRPARGMLLHGTVRQGLGGDLALPARWLAPAAGEPGVPVLLPAVAVATEFTAGIADARAYYRVGRDGTLALRGFGAGSLAGGALPPQFQHALGGPGTLPGYGALELDCAGDLQRTVRLGPDADEATEFRHGYGCDRVALFQAEYRGSLGLDFGWHRAAPERLHRQRRGRGWGQGWDDGWDRDWRFDGWEPRWSVFFDAGRGWALDRPWDAAATGGATGTGMHLDAGIGLLFGDLGVYWAVPLGDSDRSSRFTLRLGHRF